MARSLVTLLLIFALALAAADASAFARRPSPAAKPADDEAPPFAEELVASGCAGGLPPMLEFFEGKDGGDDKPDKGFHCDGDASGSGPKPSSSASSPSAAAVAAEDLARSLGWRDLNSTTRRSCWGTFRAYWRCPEHEGAGACLECKGHHSWLRAPCGAEIAVCDGLMHHFAKFEKRRGGDDDGEGSTWRVFFGAGALGKTAVVRSPPETPVISPDGDVASLRLRRRGDDNGDEGKWSNVRMTWTSEGLSGQAWTAKEVDGGWGRGSDDDDGDSFDDVAAEARAALADAGLSVLPERDAASPSPSSMPLLSSPLEGAGALRTLASRVASSLFSGPARPFDSDVRARATCNGEEPRWRGAPCKGEAKMSWESDSSDAHGSAVCDGFWSGAIGGRKCLGFSQVSASRGQWSMWKHCNGASASKVGGRSSCPWHRDNGKKGMSSWCHGGASGAVVKKPEGDSDGETEVVRSTEPQEKMVSV